jgi:hypothetical protein
VDAPVGRAQDEAAAGLRLELDAVPEEILAVNSARVSASHTFSGVLAM